MLLQDNQSAIRMKQNEQNFCMGNLRHINIWFFFVKNRVQTREIDIKYCPIEEIVAYFFTKPLQGSTFKKFRYLFMGVSDIFGSPVKETNQSSFKKKKKKESVEKYAYA